MVPTIHALGKVAAALEVTVADLVVENSERELLFSELRGAPPATIVRLRSELRRYVQRESPESLKVAESIAHSGAGSRRVK